MALSRRARRARGHDRAGHRHHQGRAHRRRARASTATASRKRVLTDAEHALRPQPAAELRRPLGGQGGRLARCSAWASAASAGATSRSCACRPASPPSASTAAPRHAPSSWAWAASPSRSATRASTRWRSPSASAPRAARSSSRPTSRSGSTSRERQILARMERLRELDEGCWLRQRPSTLDADVLQRRLLPRRDPDGHKGTFGTVVCVAGSLDYAGAGMLCATSAARGGAGLVALAVPHWLRAGSRRAGARSWSPCRLFGLKAVQDSIPSWPSQSVDERKPDALVFGPGIAETDGYHRLLDEPSGEAGAPVVVDGGGLNLLARTTATGPGRPARRLRADAPSGRVRAADRRRGSERRRAPARAMRGGRPTIRPGRRAQGRATPSSPRRMGAQPSHRLPIAALATAGSGDVLAGMIGALLGAGRRALRGGVPRRLSARPRRGAPVVAPR